MTKLKNLLVDATAPIFLGSSVLFFNPSEFFLANWDEYPYMYSDLVVSFLFISSIVTILLFLILLITKRLNAKVHEKLQSLVLVSAVIFWLQGAIGDFTSIVDGKLFATGSAVSGVINVILWFGAIIMALIYSRFFQKNGVKIGVIIVLTQIVFFTGAVLNAPAAPSFKHYYINRENKFTYSAKDNVIVLLVDTFQSDLFNELLETHPDFMDKFSGFTYYPDTVGGFPTTYPSIPLLLTGKYYDNTQPIQTFIEKAYTSSGSAFVQYRALGYETYAGCNFMIYCDTALESNVIYREQKIGGLNFLSQTLKIIKTGALKNIPHIIQAKIKGGTSLTANPDSVFLKQMEMTSKVVDKLDGTFKFFYLAGAHPPFKYDENLEPKEATLDISGFKAQAMGELKIIFAFLEIMDKLNIYDNTRVIIAADHGTGILPDPTNKVRNAAIPLVLVKEKYKRGKMAISPIKITLAGVSKFINGGLMQEFETRPFYYYSWDDGWNKAFLPPMTEYIVKGNSWDVKSYEKTGKLLSPKI